MAPKIPSKLSARNQLKGRITRISRDSILAEVEIEVTLPARIVSVITSASAEELELGEGDQVYAIVKSTEVMIGKD